MLPMVFKSLKFILSSTGKPTGAWKDKVSLNYRRKTKELEDLGSSHGSLINFLWYWTIHFTSLGFDIHTYVYMCMRPGVLSCVQLCDAMDCSLPGSSVYETSQIKILKWVDISSSRGSSWPRDWASISCIERQILYHWATWEAPYIYVCVYGSMVV